MVRDASGLRASFHHAMYHAASQQAVDALVSRCADTNTLTVLVSGVFGTDQLSVCQAAAHASAHVLMEVPTVGAADRHVGRRFAQWKDHPDFSVSDMARYVETESRRGPGPQQYVLIPEVDQLDEDSLAVVDHLIRRKRSVIFMTSSAPSRVAYRWGGALTAPHGMTLDLSVLSATECGHLMEHLLESPPTSALVSYVMKCSAGVPELVSRVVTEGTEAGWIRTVGLRSVITKPPSWTDFYTAEVLRTRILTTFGPEAVHLLERIVLGGEHDLPTLLRDPDSSVDVFRLEEAGLLRIHAACVTVSSPLISRCLAVASPDATPYGTVTADAVLNACILAEPVAEDRLISAAYELLERGLLDQARCVARALPPGHTASVIVEAQARVAEGAPRDATRILEAAMAAANVPDDELTVLWTFIENVLLRRNRSVPQNMTARPLAETVQRFEVFEEGSAKRYVDTYGPPDMARLDEAIAASATGRANLELLEVSVLLAMEAHASAAMHRRERALNALDQLSGLPLGHLPIAGMIWVLERVVMAQLQIRAGQEAVPQWWDEKENPDRALLRTVPTEALLLVHDLYRGEPAESLRVRLQDLWAQYEGGLAKGRVTRQILEAFDYSVEGDRSREIYGPGTIIAAHLGILFDHHMIRTLITVGDLLHSDEHVLEAHMDELRNSSSVSVGIWRLAVRCVILRRAATLSDDVLAALRDWAIETSVEEQVVRYANALLSGRSDLINEAVDQLGADIPYFTVTSAPATDAIPQLNPWLRSDRVRGLSSREKEIVQQIISGAPVMTVAKRLGITEHTVQTHVRRIYKKLQVSSRTELRAELLAGWSAGT